MINPKRVEPEPKRLSSAMRTVTGFLGHTNVLWIAGGALVLAFGLQYAWALKAKASLPDATTAFAFLSLIAAILSAKAAADSAASGKRNAEVAELALQRSIRPVLVSTDPDVRTKVTANGRVSISLNMPIENRGASEAYLTIHAFTVFVNGAALDNESHIIEGRPIGPGERVVLRVHDLCKHDSQGQVLITARIWLTYRDANSVEYKLRKDAMRFDRDNITGTDSIPFTYVPFDDVATFGPHAFFKRILIVKPIGDANQEI